MSTSSKRLHILSVEEKKSKAGNTYQVAQCVIYDANGEPKVGELWHFNKDLVLQKGEWDARFEVNVNMDRKVDASLVALLPYAKTAPAVAKPV